MFDSVSGEIRRWGKALARRRATAHRRGGSDIYPITLTPYPPKMGLGLNDFDKFLSWSATDRALLRGSLFHSIPTHRADVIIQFLVLTQILQGL